MEKERSQELEEIRQTRHNSSITLIEKFDNIDVEGEVKHDLVPEQDSEVLKETSEKRKAMMENFKKTLELGDSPTKTVLNQSEEELTHLDTHMKMMREKILNASLNAGLDNLKERSPVSLYDSNTDSKVEYVSEPRTELDPNIVKSSDNETSQIEKEMNLLKSEGSASASEVKKRFENLADTSPDSSKKQGLAYDEILALVKKGQERQRLENETSLDEFNQDSGSAFKEPVPITAIDTKEKIAKFKAIERGQDDKQPLTPKPPRELTPPREGEKVIYENEPITINNPNYISANSPYQQNQQPQTVGLDGTVINENKEEGTPKDNAKTLATYFESIPNTPQQVPKESPKVKKFTDPKIHVNNSDSSADVCFMCGQKIYVTEKMEFNDKPIHKTCFKCKTCNTPLRLEKYATHDNLLYCTPHFKQLYANEPGVTQAISSGKK